MRGKSLQIKSYVYHIKLLKLKTGLEETILFNYIIFLYEWISKKIVVLKIIYKKLFYKINILYNDLHAGKWELTYNPCNKLLFKHLSALN